MVELAQAQNERCVCAADVCAPRVHDMCTANQHVRSYGGDRSTPHTHSWSPQFDEINTAFVLLHSGKCLRCVLKFE